MTFLNSLNYWFNKVSPIEIHHINQPEEFKSIEKLHADETATLEDKKKLLEVQKYLLLDVVDTVKRLASASSVADVALKFPRSFRLATESPDNKQALFKITHYLKAKRYSDQELDRLTAKIMEDVGLQFPGLQDLYSKSKEILNDSQL